ncbi:hypothetical protein EGK75_13310 [Neisseria weixii]|uniref:Uncharacterized protein n=1 Tax=Neisseria weixii TaxID=1853276 RepID=A0A3N4MU37_9NEIS|nr:hypothetical protein EGK74_13185 [Neisseria weixii]RPD83353.1 hypothetical protein EGK75_13310 [Neisseria weixii]
MKVRDVSIVWFKHPDTKKVIQKYTYLYRTKDNESETKAYSNDKLFFEFEPWYDKINFADIWHIHFPKAIEIYEPRFADSSYAGYSTCYEEGYRYGEEPRKNENGITYSIVPEYNALEATGVIPNGDFNIYTLQPVVYWNKAMCLDALGFDRDEVIRRLEGKVLHIRPLNDGVYIIFNDNPLLSFDDFLAIQHTYKPLLGLSPQVPDKTESQGRLKSWLGKLGSAFS